MLAVGIQVSVTTVSETFAVTDPIVAKIVADPLDTPITSPLVAPTVATDGVSEVQLASAVTSCSEPAG
jgi:hypothetical protein